MWGWGAATAVGPRGPRIPRQDGGNLGSRCDPSPSGEIRQRLVDGLSGGADGLGELVLGEVVTHHDVPS